jgi:hypothetical protein
MWWGMCRTEDDYDFAAYGNYGQFIYVSPHKDLIIVRFGERYGIDASDWLEMFYEFSSAIEAS